MLLRRVAVVMTLVLMSAGLASSADAQRGPYEGGRFGSSGDMSRQRNVAGQFDYFALVMSWSPTHCGTDAGDRDTMQCSRRDGRRYAFVLHGLWPQYEKGFPESCPTARRPFVPQQVIDGMLDIMPSPKLVIHEYRKHGTCSGLGPAQYYDLSRQLFQRIKVPQRFVNPFEAQFVSPEDVRKEFLQANPELKPEMIVVACGGSGNRLREVRVCFSGNGTLRACGRNEEQRRLCSADKMFVPPVRSTKAEPDTPADRARASGTGTPAGPRVIPSLR